MLRIILAGIFAVPCLLVCICTAPLVALLSIPSLLLLLFRKGDDTNTKNNKHHTQQGEEHYPDNVVIVGGSSGIGLSIAKQLCHDRHPKLQRIILLARTKDKLEQAQQALHTILASNNQQQQQQDTPPSISIEIASVSVSNYEDLCAVAQKLALLPTTSITNTAAAAAAAAAPPHPKTVLFNCAGIPYTTGFENVPVDKFRSLIETNQLGAMYVTKAFLPYINYGTLVFTSSAAGQVGVYGYSAYSPTKYALRGFAETMHAELLYTKPNVHIQIAFPADTDTPGYEQERKMMPPITQKLNESAGLANPDDTAKEMIRCAFVQHPKFAVYFNLEGWLLTNLTAGMSPVSNLSDALTQVALSGMLRFISLFYLNDFWRIINQFRTEDATKNKEKNRSSSSKKAD